MGTPGTLAYPTALDDADSLFRSTNDAYTVLDAQLTAADTTATVASTALFPSTGSFTVVVGGIPVEIVYYTGKTATTFTGLIRGRDGTSDATRANGSGIERRITNADLQILRDAVLALETKAGFGADTPAASEFFKGTGAGSSGWASLTSGEITTALGFTPANKAGDTLTGHLLFSADNTYDIGASGATRPRDLFLGRNARIGGTLTVSTSPVLVPDGSAANPVYSFTTEPTSGFYYNAGSVSLSLATNDIFRTHNSGYFHLGPNFFSWGASVAGAADVILTREAAGVLVLRNATNPQEIRVYNTYTDSSNYERATLGWSSNVLEIGAEALGSGTLRNVSLLGTQILLPDGLIGTPSLAFASNAGNGFYKGGAGSMGVSGNLWVNDYLWIRGGDQSIYFGASSDVVLTRDAATALAQRNGVNPQQFRIYNTYTDASNYERLVYGWASNDAYLENQEAGTGTQRGMFISAATLGFQIAHTTVWKINSSGHLLAHTDNTYDIGASGATRPRDLFLGQNAVIGGTLAAGATTLAGHLIFTDATYDIGASGATRPRDIFLSRNAVIGGTLTSGATTHTGNLIFSADNTHDIGAAGATRARDLFLGRNAVIGGTLAAGATTLAGNLIFTDATYDIGASGATRPRDIFLSRNAVIGGTLAAGATLLTGHLTFTDNTYDIGASGATRPRVGYFSSALAVGTNPASAGAIRLANAESVAARNAANSADINLIKLNASNLISLNDDVVRIGSAGMGIGITSSTTTALRLVPPTDGVALAFATTAYTTDAQKILLNAQTVMTVTTPIATGIYGLLFIPTIAGTEGVNTNTIATIHGVYSRADVGASFDSNITAIYNYSSGNPIDAGGGTIATVYGLYVETLTAGTANWGIHVNGNNSFFGGNISIGSSGYVLMAGVAGNPGSLAAGDFWYNTTQKSHRFQSTAGTQGLVGLIYTRITDDALSSGGTAELKFASQIALAAAGLTVGKVIRVRLRGNVTTDATANQTMVVNVKLGDATNATSGTTVATTRFALTLSITNANWSVDADIVIRSATTAWGAGFGVIGATAAAPWTAAVTSVSNGGGVGTVTTIPNISTVHTVHATGTPNDAGMTITLRTMTVEILD